MNKLHFIDKNFRANCAWKLILRPKTGPNSQSMHGQEQRDLLQDSRYMRLSLKAGEGLLLLVFLLLALPLFGQSTLSRLGSEFAITGNFPGDQVNPAVALGAGGGFVAWEDNATDGSGAGVSAASLNAGFVRQTTFRVDKVGKNNQVKPQVALLQSNLTVFVWEGNAAGTPDIYARFLKQDGTFATGDIRVNTYIRDQQVNPDVVGLADGTALVVWSSYNQDGSMMGVYARKVGVTAAASGKEFQVNQYAGYNQRTPAVATLADGNYVIVWISEQERYFESVDVYARIFTPAGVPVTDEISINSGANICANPAVAGSSDGGFTVVWSEKDKLVRTNSWDIMGRAFSSSGAPTVADFKVNSFVYGDQYRPKLASGPTGSLVVWTSLGEDGSREGVFGRFLLNGNQVSGDEFRVNATTVSQQVYPTVGWNGTDRFLVIWSSHVVGGFDLFGQAYVLNSLSK